MSPFLPEGVKKAFVQVEFIVDADGVPVNFNILRFEILDEFTFEQQRLRFAVDGERLEKMPVWQPALLNDKAVAKKMVQTVTIEAQ